MPGCHPRASSFVFKTRKSGIPLKSLKMFNNNYYVYITTNKKDGVLYIGVTNNLEGRISEHKERMYKGFTYKYGLDKLVYYEIYNDIKEAIEREKQLKKWNRDWKIKLIEEENPNWNDLFATF